ncbi:MAG: hypothetical protein A07HR67_00480 [uncultured archaeon A07HR67]|nr:MAG: hypothetical protein A07HR67_00480 [uncultured archaeon A07HR67]
MEHTPDGTPVGVDDPYAVAGMCDHLTDDGRCRFALTRGDADPDFAAARRADDYACHVGPDEAWRACPHYRSTTDGRECARCGLAEVRLAHEDARPLVEEHHLSYRDGSGSAAGNADTASDAASNANGDTDAGPHEITVALCRWCHAKVHGSFARIDDDASPDPEAIAEREGRRTREREESAFETARKRYDQGE